MKTIMWNGYAFREDGVVLNKDGTIKKPVLNKKGYPSSAFYYNGKLKSHLIHTLMAYLFHGECPAGCEVDHIDNDRTNFKPNNLQYLNKSDNNRKSYTSGGRNVSGFNNANQKYTEQQLQRVFDLLEEGLSYGVIQRFTGVGKGTVAKVAKGKHFLSGTFRD